MSPLVWPLKSYDPYNMIGRFALQDVYKWSAEGKVKHRIIFGSRHVEDLIVVSRSQP